MTKGFIAVIAGVLTAAGGIAVAGYAGKSDLSCNEAPKLGVSVTHIQDDRDGKDGAAGLFYLHDGVRCVKSEWQGAFAFADDARSIAAMGRVLEIEMRDGGALRKATFNRADRNDPSPVVVVLTIGGKAVEDPAEREAGLADLVQTFARASGVGAKARIAALIREGGVDAAISEIDQLTTDYAVQTYIETLARAKTLNDAQIRVLSSRIARLNGGHAVSEALAALLETQDITSTAMPSILAAASKIDGDHELQKLIETVAERALTPGAMEMAFALFARIEGGHGKVMAATALLENGDLDDVGSARVISEAAAQIEGAHDLAMLLREAARLIVDAPVAAAACLEALEKIGSSHERSMVIGEFAENLPADSPYWTRLIEAARDIESDHDAAMALVRIAEEMPDDPALDAAYRKAAAEISSDHDRSMASRALAER